MMVFSAFTNKRCKGLNASLLHHFFESNSNHASSLTDIRLCVYIEHCIRDNVYSSIRCLVNKSCGDMCMILKLLWYVIIGMFIFLAPQFNHSLSGMVANI